MPEWLLLASRCDRERPFEMEALVGSVARSRPDVIQVRALQVCRKSLAVSPSCKRAESSVRVPTLLIRYIVLNHVAHRLPSNHPSPDAGYSVDTLKPVLIYTPVFTYTHESGFSLVSTARGSVNPSLPIGVPLCFNTRRKVEDVPGNSDLMPRRYGYEVGPSFPSRDAVRAHMIRSLNVWGQPVETPGAPGSVKLESDVLIAPAFSLQVKRDERPEQPPQPIPSTSQQTGSASQASTLPNGMGMIQQAATSSVPSNAPAAQQPQPQILLSNPGGNHLFRAFLEGIGVALPREMQESLFQNTAEGQDRELFYPIPGPLPTDRPECTLLSEPARAASLKGLWAGSYSSHGHEFGRISLRTVWTRLHTADEVALEQIYDEDGALDFDDADPSVAREPLAPNLEGSIRRRRVIVEYIKITGDVNVPAGQVSWVAILPTEQDARLTASGLTAAEFYAQADLDEPDLETLPLPTIKRSDLMRWSDAPPHTARLNIGEDVPRWNEGTVGAAGRIAFDGFVDTRFIDCQATFVRDDSGAVDEIRIRWCVPVRIRAGGKRVSRVCGEKRESTDSSAFDNENFGFQRPTGMRW